MKDEWVDGAQMGVASVWVGLSLRGFWVSGNVSVGEKPSTNGKPRINEWTMCKWESLRTRWACPCGGFWVLAGASVGERKDERFA
jgi:hypothetical protein